MKCSPFLGDLIKPLVEVHRRRDLSWRDCASAKKIYIQNAQIRRRACGRCESSDNNTSTSYIWANLCPHSEVNNFRALHRSISATELLWCNTDLQSSRDKCFLSNYLHNSGVWIHCVIYPSLIISRGMPYRICGCKSAYTVGAEFTYNLGAPVNHSRSLPNSIPPLKTDV